MPDPIYNASADAETRQLSAVPHDEQNPVRRLFSQWRIANMFAPPSLSRLRERMDKTRAQLTELETEEQRSLSALEKWNGLVSQYEKLQAELATAEIQRADLVAYKDRLHALIYEHEHVWGTDCQRTYSKWSSSVGMAELFGLIAGAERAMENYPEWVARQNAKIAEVEKELVSQAKATGIARTHLPAHLQST